ncbi:MAG: hypothetical protein MI919_15140 [Holophagales bacterium]|nr:hypothetical protein [Holophagales bacterium]
MPSRTETLSADPSDFPSFIPGIRLDVRVREAPRPEGEYVLYWMVASRRTRWSFALDQAVGWAEHLGKPLVVLEALRVGYRWASDRFHRFVLEGMAENARRLKGEPVLYHAYLEPSPGAGSGLLEALAEKAAVVVTDEYPDFFLPRMLEAAAGRLTTRLEAVDGNGLLPLRAPARAYSRAVDFRRFLQKRLPPHLLETPSQDPFAGVEIPRLEALPAEITERWPSLSPTLLDGRLPDLSKLAIDHRVRPVEARGGERAAASLLTRFLDQRLERYREGRLNLERRSTSELSPYLHFGHISSHQVFHEVAAREGWTPGHLGEGPHRGKREGWWGMGVEAEAYLDELVTWRELGSNGAFHLDQHHRYESLPKWARATLEEHAGDPREYLYTLEEFEQALTHDELWNAAQRELVNTGTIHNYLRMLWGKKILEWSTHPREALEVMIELNNKFALDGRDPNSYSGIFWVLGRYDRAWGPERPIFGKIRYMTSGSTLRKVRLGNYLERFGPRSSGRLEAAAPG